MNSKFQGDLDLQIADWSGSGYGHAEFFPEWPGDGDGWGGWGNAYGDVPGDGSGSGCWDDCE